MQTVTGERERTGTSELERYVIAGLIFYFASGTLAHTLPAVLPVTRYITDVLLFATNGVILYTLYRQHRDRALLTWLGLAYVFTFATEAVGVATGAVFGEYAYGATMWVQWLGVPFAIALNWCVLTLACNDLSIRLLGPAGEKQFLLKSVLLALASSVLIALYDVVIEPVAIALDYWTWAAVEIPLQNYLAWGVVAFIISLPLHLLRIRFTSPVLIVYLFAQLFFFAALNFLL